MVEVPAKQINAAVGHHAKNKKALEEKFGTKIKFVPNNDMPIYTYNVL